MILQGEARQAAEALQRAQGATARALEAREASVRAVMEDRIKVTSVLVFFVLLIFEPELKTISTGWKVEVWHSALSISGDDLSVAFFF